MSIRTDYSVLPFCCLQFFWTLPLSCKKSDPFSPLVAKYSGYGEDDVSELGDEEAVKGSSDEDDEAAKGSSEDSSPNSQRSNACHEKHDVDNGRRARSQTDRREKTIKKGTRKGGRTYAKPETSAITLSSKKAKCRRRKRFTVIPRALRR
jgi:hypothetical protein